MYFNNNVVRQRRARLRRPDEGRARLPRHRDVEQPEHPRGRSSAIRCRSSSTSRSSTSGGQVDRETAVQVGKLLGAQHMIFGGFMTDPKGNFRIDARAVNVETGAIEYAERVQDHGDNVMALIGQLAGAASTRGSSSARRRRDAGTTPATQPLPDARRSRCTARRSTWPTEGDKAKAVELFGAVLKEFPDYAPARQRPGQGEVRRLTVRDSIARRRSMQSAGGFVFGTSPTASRAMKPLLLTALGRTHLRRAARPPRRRRRGARASPPCRRRARSISIGRR